jgi:hypothetical protein
MLAHGFPNFVYSMPGSALNKDRISTIGQPPNEGPLTNLAFSDERCCTRAIKNKNINPGYVVDDKKHGTLEDRKTRFLHAYTTQDEQDFAPVFFGAMSRRQS